MSGSQPHRVWTTDFVDPHTGRLDVSSPDTSLASTRAATAPDAATVSAGGTAYRQSFTYDWLGNRAAMTEHDPANATKNVSFKYGYGTPQPHTMKGISSDPAGEDSSYTYDGTKTTYVYDTAGNRVLENSPSGSTLYLGGTEVTADAAGAVVRASRTYGQAGAPSVTRTASNGATTGHRLSVLLTDHLGTADTAVSLWRWSGGGRGSGCGGGRPCGGVW